MPQPLLNRKWIIAEPEAESRELSDALKIPALIGHLLWQRGLRTVEAAEAFLEPRLQALGDPFALTDLRVAAIRIHTALELGERMVIYGDYDVDGITSSALLWRILKRLGGRVETFLPQRLAEGYGLSRDGLQRCVVEHRPQVVLAVDCGTTSVDEVKWLTEQGIEVMIFDHHTLPERLPCCHALVNPQRDGHSTYLASVGVVFKLCHGLLKLIPDGPQRIDLREYLDLVAVGTVADLVPLQDDNRIFVRRGLSQLEKTLNPGLRALLSVGKIRGKPTPQDVGFRIGPRLNASGRLGDALRSLTLLKTEDAAEAAALAQQLDQSNRERQTLEQAISEEAQAELEAVYDPERDWAIVLGKRGWHIGVIGIVASRLQRRYHRPAIVIGFDEDGIGKGSGRSIEGCSLVDGLRAQGDLLKTCGGHDMAAGLTLAEENLPAFRQAFNVWVKHHLVVGQLQPTLAIAARLTVPEISEAFFEEVQLLAPFGQKNPEPVFAFAGVKPLGGINRFGTNHLKFFLSGAVSECEAVGFGMAEREMPPQPFDMAGTLDWDDYRRRVQVRMIDWKAAS